LFMTFSKARQFSARGQNDSTVADGQGPARSDAGSSQSKVKNQQSFSVSL
jgi:hypothetical protein